MSRRANANNLDTTPSPLRYLPGVIDAVGEEAEVTFDSGIRRGADVVKARPGREGGARRPVVVLRPGRRRRARRRGGARRDRLSIDRTLIALGKSSLHELSPDDLVVPEGSFLEHAEPLPMAA